MVTAENRAPRTGRRRWLRFSLKSAMVLTLLFAVGLGAFRFGRDVGFEEGNREGFAAGINAQVYPKVYRVADLLLGPVPQSGQADYAALMDEIAANVQPTSWEESGGPATFAPYPQNLSLVVSQTSRGHNELSEFLESKRRKVVD